MIPIRALALLCLPALVLPARPEAAFQLQGRVVRILDGDTVELLVGGFRTERIRLVGIDAPEKGQPFGTASRKRLASLCFLRDLQVRADKRDRYGRLLGRLFAGGEDLNRRMIAEGMAWHYAQYAREQPLGERTGDARAEQEARAARRGLWSDPDPVAPWDWRHRGRGRGRRR